MVVVRRNFRLNLPLQNLDSPPNAQNSAARLVSLSKKRDHITPILQNLHWLPVRSRINYKVILLTFKIIHGYCPDYLTNLISPYNPPRTLRSTTQNLLTVKKCRTKTFGNRSFSYAAPTLWNSLPPSLRSQPNLDLFKIHLKSYLFSCSY